MIIRSIKKWNHIRKIIAVVNWPCRASRKRPAPLSWLESLGLTVEVQSGSAGRRSAVPGRKFWGAAQETRRRKQSRNNLNFKRVSCTHRHRPWVLFSKGKSESCWNVYCTWNVLKSWYEPGAGGGAATAKAVRVINWKFAAYVWVYPVVVEKLLFCVKEVLVGGGGDGGVLQILPASVIGKSGESAVKTL